MKVLLLQDVKSLGKKGEVKEVKEGYGKNFLIGKGLAKHATTDVLRQYDAAQKRKQEAEAAELERLKTLAEKLKTTELTIEKKLGANGHLYGAITKEEISDVLATAGFEVDKKAVEIKGAIKATGLYEISLKLGHGLHPHFKLNVVGV